MANKHKNVHFLQNGVRYGVLLCLTFILFFIPKITYAILDDDFSTYSSGDLTGQGDWEDWGNNKSWTVTSSCSGGESGNCIYPNTDLDFNYNSINTATTTTGVFTMRFYVPSDFAGYDAKVYLDDDDVEEASPPVNIDIDYNQIVLNNGDSSQVIYATGDLRSSWHDLQIFYTTADDYFTIKLDATTTSEQVSFHSADPDISGIDRLIINGNAYNGGFQIASFNKIIDSETLAGILTYALTDSFWISYPIPFSGQNTYLLETSDEWAFEFSRHTASSTSLYNLKLEEYSPKTVYPTSTATIIDERLNILDSDEADEDTGAIFLYPINASSTAVIGYKLTVDKYDSEDNFVENVYTKVFQTKGSSSGLSLPFYNGGQPEDYVPEVSLSGVWGYLKTKVPFSYVFELQTAIDEVTATTTTVPTLNINTGTSTPIQINMTFFSEDTIKTYLSDGTIAILRDLVLYALWIAFATMVFFETRKLF